MKQLIVLCLLFLNSSFALEKPNIIIFYVDDLGWQDTELLNDVDVPCPYKTPNIAKLAEMGMNFPQGYSPAPTCAPSRAAIISGLHPALTNYTHVTAASIPKQGKDNEFHEPFLGSYFDLSHPTIADVLRGNEYTTGHFGKWHAGLNSSAFGFEHFNHTRGAHRGSGDRTKDFATDSGQYKLSKEKYPPYTEDHPEGISYPYDELTESALQFVRDHKEGPFFLNLCHWMVHWPAVTKNKNLLEYYCIEMDHPFPPPVGEMTEEGQRNPYFASMVTTVDWSLGRLMDLLKTTDDPRHPGKKLMETTYLFFTSDNGGAVIRGKETLSSNAPLKYGKKHAEEGGVRVPLVITGPGIAPKSESQALINQLDFFPSILTLTSSLMEEKAAAQLSGLDISPLLLGESTTVNENDGTPRESLFWHFPHNQMKAGIRKGDYKLYRNFAEQNYSLYRLYKDRKREDLEEAHDLIADEDYKATKEELIKELNELLDENDAELPYRNPKFRNAKLPMAKIASLEFKEATATVTLAPEASKATKAFILYYDTSSKDAKGHNRSHNFDTGGDPEIGYQIKIPATISKSGHLISASIPDEVLEVRFIIIDENNYCHFTDQTPKS